MTLVRICFAALVAATSPTYAAATPSLLKDINAFPDADAGSAPAQFVSLGGVAYFSARRDFGGELWRTDGTVAGTFRVKAVEPLFLRSSSNRLFFVSSDPAGGHDLWASDGSEAGTLRLKHFDPQPASSSLSQPSHLTVVGNMLYFDAVDPEHGRELWHSDGTAEGTRLVLDLRPGPAAGLPFTGNRFGVIGSNVYFFAFDDHDALWTSDGTAEGTHEVSDVYPSFAALRQDTPIVSALGRLWFVSNHPQLIPSVWVSDGTDEGTQELRPGEITANPFVLPTFVAAGARVYFAAGTADDGVELWSSDGTDAGTSYLDVRPGPDGSHPRSLTADGDSLYFVVSTATTPTETQGELWRFDGTAARRLGDLAGASGLSMWNGILYFSAPEGDCAMCPYRPYLWRSDGTSAGTVRLLSAGTPILAPHDFFPLGDALLFGAADPLLGDELWTSDGTGDGSHLLVDIVARSGASFSSLNRFVELGNEVYFPAFDGIPGAQFWASDGTEGGTRKIDLSAASQSLAPQRLTRAGNELFFFVPDGPQAGLWHSDGTTEGSQQIAGAPLGDPSAVSNDLFFFGTHNNDGQLWRSDGSEAGTFALAHFDPFYLRQLTDLRGTLLFGYGADLWRSDGTVEGTQMVATLSGSITAGQAVGSRFFAANAPCNIYGDPTGGRLWVSDGSPAGTQLVRDSVCPAQEAMAALHDRLYFISTSGTPQNTNASLWTSNGTAAGTAPVVDLASKPPWLLSSGGRGLAIFSENPSGEILVWASDGTTSGTEVVATIPQLAPTGYSTVDDRLSIGGRVYFVVTQQERSGGDYHRTLWVTDGTADGTRPLFDMPTAPRNASSPLLSAGVGRIFFGGWSDDASYEPWSFPLEASLCAGDCDGDGFTSVVELLRGVRRALGDSAATCPALGDGPLTVDRLVRSVGAATGPCAGAGNAA